MDDEFRDKALSFCLDEVRKHDRDRYLALLATPPQARRSLVALYAFNAEIARVGETVSQPLLGEMRLQWWRDGLKGKSDGEAHPAIPLLKEGFTTAGEDIACLETLIDGRRGDLYGEPPESWEDLDDYLSATSSALMVAALKILGAATPAALEKARHLGLAYGYVGLARALDYQRRRGRCLLPRRHWGEMTIRQEDFMQYGHGLAEIRRLFIIRAESFLTSCPPSRPEKTAWPALLPAICARIHLKALQQGRDGASPLALQWALLWRGFIRRL